MKSNLFFVFVIFLAFCNPVYADVEVKSQNGNSAVFSQPKYGDNIESNAWRKLTFNQNGIKIDLSRADRYYTEDGSSKVSPSGNYLVVNSIAGGYLDSDNSAKKYVSKAYCSVIDMRNGCIVSDWNGEACGYRWAKSEDVLSDSDDNDADTFDFLSMKPSVRKIAGSYTTLKKMDANNLMRCDKINSENIDDYQTLSKENKDIRQVVLNGILDYINKLEMPSSINTSKAYLYSSSDESSITKAYLVAGDKVKVIKFSLNNKWVKVGYVSPEGKPLVNWVESEDIKKF